METLRKDPPYAPSKRSIPLSSSPESSSESGGVFPYLHILRNRKGLIAGIVFLSLLFAFFVNLRQKPVYQASTELILQSRSKTPTVGQAPTSFLQDATLLATQFRLIRGPRLAERVLRKLEKPENREALLRLFAIRPSRKRKETSVFSDGERQALLGSIRGSISVRQPERAVRIITISVEGYDPPMVARLADAVAEAYIEINYSAHLDSFRQSFGMISKSLAEIREKIKTGEIASQKINSEIRLLEALKIYGEKHPLVIQLRSEIPELAQKLKLSGQNLETMEISQRKDLVPLLRRPILELEELQKIESDLYTLKPLLEQEVNSNREMYNSIFHRLQEIEIEGGGSEWVDAKVVERATVPGQPVRPNKKMNLMLGLFFGVFFGTGLAFFIEYLDSSMRSMEDVRSYLKLFPLGMVPQVEFGEKEEKGEGEKEGQTVDKFLRPFWLASDSDVPLFVAEAYRIIRTNLAFGSIDTTLKVLQVTSAVKGEGKTTTAANLAISLASAGSKTLLVDADLRRPALHRILGLPGGAEGGLTESLTNGKSWQSVMLPTPIPNLFFIGSGTTPHNPAELLSSKRMKALMEELKEHFDMVIFDSPPVISVADSAIIGSRVDGTILVSRSGFIPRHLCLHAKNALESVHAKVIGCVLNGVRTQHQPYYYYEYYRQYGRYHEEGEENQKSRGETPSLSPSSETLEKLRALKEPLLVFLSTGWARLAELLKWERFNQGESKSSVGRE